MKNKMLNQIAALVVASSFLAGCASSDNMDDNTTDTTMSETQTMEGDVAVDDVDVDADVDADVDDVEMEADVDMDADAAIAYDDMFDDLGDTKQYDILALAKSNQNLSMFVDLLQRAELTTALQAGGPFTVLIPTNDAFQKLTKEQYNQLIAPENKSKLVQVLQTHMFPSEVFTTDLQTTKNLKTADGKMISVLVEPNNNVTIGGARIVKPNVEVSNGVVHIVNDIVMASEADGGLIDR